MYFIYKTHRVHIFPANLHMNSDAARKGPRDDGDDVDDGAAAAAAAAAMATPAKPVVGKSLMKKPLTKKR
jgi:hypothetical protein